MTIRKATVDDAVAIARIGAEVQEMHHEHGPDWFRPPSAQSTVALYEGLLQDPAVTAYLDKDDGVTWGFVIFRVGIHKPDNPLAWAQTIVNIDQIGVVRSARRRGVGHELINAARDLANEVSASLIDLTTWEFNREARQFFEAEWRRCVGP